jgi:tRNA (guanine-N7-)-methyltransferase
MWITAAEYFNKINADSRKYFEINENIYEITPDKIPIDFTKIFNNENSVLKFEIGFGNGESIIKLAKKNPDINYFGIDRKMDRVRTALARLNKAEPIPNLKIARSGTDYIEEMIKSESFDEVIMNFPDPWPKKKHHKNRTINDEFIKIIHSILKTGGIFRFASDHEEYSMEVLGVFQDSEIFESLYENGFKNEVKDRIQTQFEKHKIKAGLKIFHLKFKKKT